MPSFFIQATQTVSVLSGKFGRIVFDYYLGKMHVHVQIVHINSNDFSILAVVGTRRPFHQGKGMPVSMTVHVQTEVGIFRFSLQ